MPYPSFPDIQAPDMNGGIQEETYRPLRRTEFEGNTTAVRARSVRARKRWTLKWSKLPQADYDALRAFFADRQGSPFSWHNVSDGYQYTVVFSDDQLRASSAIYDGATASMRYSVQTAVEECVAEWQFAAEDSNAVYDGPPIVLKLFVTPGQTVSFVADSLCSIDWGDGDTETDSGDPISHEYENGGNYTLKVTPSAGLEELNFSGLGAALVEIVRWDVPETVTSFRGMFRGASLTSLPLFNLHHNAVEDVSEEFDGCLLLESLGGLTNPDSVANAYAQFYECVSLKYLNVFTNGANTADCSLQFCRCYSLEEIPDTFRNGTGVVTMAQQFAGAGLTYAPFYNIFPAGKTPLQCRWAFSGCRRLTGFVPPERTWQSKRTFQHNQLAAPFQNCTGIDNYYDMPATWSGQDFTQEQVIAVTFVDNSGVLDSTVNGDFTFHLQAAETDENDVTVTVASGIAPAVTLIRGQVYEVIPPEGYAKVFRARFYPATVFSDREAELESTFNAGRGVHSIELLAVPSACRAVYKVKFTSDVAHHDQKILTFKTSSYPSDQSVKVSWGDGTVDYADASSPRSWQPEHTFADGEYIVMIWSPNCSRTMLTDATTGATTAEADARTAPYGQHIVELYWYYCTTDMTRAFMNCKFTKLPDDFEFRNAVNGIKECFFNVPMSEIPDNLFDAFTSGTKSVSNAFRVDTWDAGSFTIPELWSRTDVTFTNQSDCFTGRVNSPNFKAAVANGWAADPPVDASDESSEIRSLASALETAAEDLHTRLDEGDLDEDSDWRPVRNAIESMRKTAGEIAWHQWRYVNAGNLLPIYASQWALADGENEIQTEFIDVISETRYSITLNAGYKMTLRYYSADDVLRDAFVYNATVGGTTYHTTASNVAKVQVMLSLLSGEDISASQLTLDAASPRMEVAP
ncbi:MAG: hypothetical protein IJJ33_13595 [Victivallales bacterium]|nr:hypothetical protein [Victivallales bacterium]